MIAAIYARKSTDQSGVVDEAPLLDRRSSTTQGGETDATDYVLRR